MKTYKIKCRGQQFEVYPKFISKPTAQHPAYMIIRLVTVEPSADFVPVTICFADNIGVKNLFCANVTMYPWVSQLLEQNFAEDIGFVLRRGKRSYPLWNLTQDALKAMLDNEQNAKQYRAYEADCRNQFRMRCY